MQVWFITVNKKISISLLLSHLPYKPRLDMLDIHVRLNLETEGALVMLGVTITWLVSWVKQASECPNDVVCVYGWRVIDREVASIEDSTGFKYLQCTFQKNSNLLMRTAQMFIQVEKLQDLSYKINPVIENCQILNRMPTVDEAAGVGAQSALSHVIT